MASSDDEHIWSAFLNTPGATSNDLSWYEKKEGVMTKNTHEGQQALVDAINELFDDQVFELSGPASLTVYRSEGKYSKESHVGMETFTIGRAYLGKKGAAIVTLNPKETARYQHAEIEVMKMSELFKGSDKIMEETIGMTPKRFIDKMKYEATKEAEDQMNKARSEIYEDFGAW